MTQAVLFKILVDPIVWLIISGMFFSVLTKKLTVYASLTGGVLAFLIYAGLGPTGMLLLATFFILGTAVTSWRYGEKKQMHVAENATGRTSGQVLANAGFPSLIALLSILLPEHQQLFLLMAAAGFSAAAADTVSSELGTLYGKRFYNILSLKPDKRGLDGVVSIEGTLFGIVGSVLIASVFAVMQGLNTNFFWIVFAGTVGNMSDSVLGASLERSNALNNNQVNFLNTLVAGFSVLLSLIGA